MCLDQSPYTADDVLLAPLSGISDLPFREACRRQGCHYAFAPLIDVGSVAYGNPHNQHRLIRGESEPWLGVQLLGAEPQLVARAAEALADLPFDVFDFNLGCPVAKVTRRGAGAALGLDTERARRCVDTILRRVRVPVTAKIRVLDATDPAPTLALARALEACGIAALTVHGRTWAQVYSGPVATGVIAAIRETLRIPVIANGGVFTRADAERLRRESGCRHVMIARGAIGNPWLFRELHEATAPPPTHLEFCAELEQHVTGMVRLYGADIGLRNARKIILAYLKGRGYRRSLRATVTSVATMAEFAILLRALVEEGPQRPPSAG